MRNFIENNLRENLKSYTILALILLLGLIIGIMFVNNMETVQKEEINTYLTGFIEELKNDNKINYLELLKNSVINNLEFVILIVLLNFSIWGGISNFALFGYKGNKSFAKKHHAIVIFFKKASSYQQNHFLICKMQEKGKKIFHFLRIA